MSKSNNKRKKREYNRPNFWGMIQNVLIASLNKGQLLGGVVGLCVIIMVIKLPSEDTKELILEFLAKFGDYHYIGWILGVFSTIGWYFGTKRTRRIHTEEIRRISEEKKQLQIQLTKKKLRSSK